MYAQSDVARKFPTSLPLANATSVAALPATLGHIFAAQISERLEVGEALFWQGDTASHVFEISSGALRTVRVLSDGRRVITGFLFAGDVVGVSLKDRYLTTVEAIAPCLVRRLARRRFDEAVEQSTTLRPQLLAQLRDEMVAAQDQVMLLARKTAEERVASFLLALARRAGQGCQPDAIVALPMTRLDMADYLGLTIETVSRVMTRLTGRGIIAPVGRHAIAIRRPAALMALAVDDEADEDVGYRAVAAN
jgi:CRP/FNR family transcriptional regulator